MASDWQTQLDASANEMNAEELAQNTLISAQIQALTEVTDERVGVASDNYSTDMMVGIYNANTRVLAEQTEGQGHLNATQIVTTARVFAVSNTTAAQSL